ncbi:dienelactone hydrolase family protein [Halomonas sp. M4R1S46]|uniref:dienelactone hydrolase family protein n=1 Tax=Halomonas sp. M4R1S46 TaxID=2982692 RepID=UPI0021E36107|nr:alpha/beta family hydrolase [Halomonas sp. M4R1S46]UYG06124.1 alpha/beta fold hydrolase [Halomonas sp. M4R1S46]
MAVSHHLFELALDDAALEGDLLMPEQPKGLVVFAHGSGSSRLSPRNQQVARFLADQGLAALLFDLLTPDENIIDERTRALRFDIDLISRRLIGAVDRVSRASETRSLGIGLFGASTGAAAALIAAAARPEQVRAVVSRGGRVDLAGDQLAAVRAPTLLLVGENDPTVLRLNEQARQGIPGRCELVVVPGATHLFEEPGTLEAVQEHAARWLLECL